MPKHPREVEDRQHLAVQVPDPEHAPTGAGHGAQLAELGHLEHVLDRHRIALDADAQPDVLAAHATAGARQLLVRRTLLRGVLRASRSRSPTSSSTRCEVIGALRLLGRELLGRRPDLHDRRRDLVGSRLLLLGREDRLLEHRRRRGHQLADLARLARPLLGRHDRRVRLVLDRGDDLADRLRRGHRPLRQLAHLGRHDREPAPGLAGARGLDRRVQRQQVRLLGDLVDQLEDLPDLLAPLTERERALGDRLHLLLHVPHRVAGLLGGSGDRARLLRDRGRRDRQLLDRRRGLGDRRRLLGRRGLRLLGAGPQLRATSPSTPIDERVCSTSSVSRASRSSIRRTCRIM